MKKDILFNMFISASAYSRPVDRKKLKFIYSEIKGYANSSGKEISQLSILEVACGKGGITLPLASLGCKVTAFDIEEESVVFLNQRLLERRINNVKISVDNGYYFDDGKMYDIVIASEVFEHVPEPLMLASNITKRMRDNSRLIITVPNGYGPWELKNRLYVNPKLRISNRLRYALGKPLRPEGTVHDHCQYYKKMDICNMMSKYSLNLLTFEKSDSILAISKHLSKKDKISKFDIKMADKLPYWLASGWYFAFYKK